MRKIFFGDTELFADIRRRTPFWLFDWTFVFEVLAFDFALSSAFW